MKKMTLIPILALSQMIAACGGSYSKNPVTDLETLRENGKLEVATQDERNLQWSDLEVKGLPAEVSEGTLTPFEVNVQVGGLETIANQAPKLKRTFDGEILNANKQSMELDGTRHVKLVEAANNPESLGEGRWKFRLTFDTKNVSVKPPMGPNKKVLDTAVASYVRFKLQVTSVAGENSDLNLQQIRIKLVKPISAPRFDFNGVAPEAVELTPGETLTLPFFAMSGDPTASVSVDAPNLKTLPGSPSMVCRSPQDGKNRRDCVLTWAVPCVNNPNELNQEIPLSTVATIDGKNSAPVKSSLKTTASKKASKCPATNKEKK